MFSHNTLWDTLWAAIAAEWYRYVPPVISLYLVVILPQSRAFLKQLVRGKENSDLLEAVASDWALRLNLINAMSASLLTSFLVFPNNQTYGLATFIILFIIFLTILWWVIGLPTGDLSTRRTNLSWRTLWQMIAYGDVIRAILIALNIILIAATFASQLVKVQG